MTLAIILFSFIFVAAFFMLRGSKKDTRRDHLRGQSLATGAQVADQIKRQKLPTRLSIGGVPVPVAVEDRGFLLAGSQGTGKSQAITCMLDTLRAAGHRAVIADATGIFYNRYANERAKLDRAAAVSSSLQQQASEISAIDANVKGLQFVANQNVQVQALLSGIGTSISAANAHAYEVAAREQKKEKEASSSEADFLAARRKMQDEYKPDSRLKMPWEYSKGAQK